MIGILFVSVVFSAILEPIIDVAYRFLWWSLDLDVDPLIRTYFGRFASVPPGEVFYKVSFYSVAASAFIRMLCLYGRGPTYAVTSLIFGRIIHFFSLALVAAIFIEHYIVQALEFVRFVRGEDTYVPDLPFLTTTTFVHGVFEIAVGIPLGLLLLAAFVLIPMINGVVVSAQIFWLANPVRTRLWRARSRDLPFATREKSDLLLVSDLHITADGETTIEKANNESRGSDLIERAIASSGAPAILITGDLTDAGGASAWRNVAQRVKGWGAKVLAVPGNHDYHFKTINEPWISFGSESYDCRDVAAWLGSAGIAFWAVGDAPSLVRLETPPMDILLLDSNRRPSGWPVTNAVGLVGQEQLFKAEELLRGRAEGSLLIALHHHVVPLTNSIVGPLLSCVDSARVLDLALRFKAVAIVHGHTHQPNFMEYRDSRGVMRIISVGSALFRAGGRRKAEVKSASCFGISLDQTTREIACVLYR